jgi:solute carrier family 35 protein C2
MCKSSVLGFVLLFAFVFRLEKPTLPLIGVITIITAGVIMMVSSETQFHLVGMMQVLTASCLSGLRWSLTQILLDKESMGMNNPFATLFWLAPIMGISLALCSIFIEGWFTVFSSQFFDGIERTLLTMAIILLPGVLAFSMSRSAWLGRCQITPDADLARRRLYRCRRWATQVS